MIFASSWPPESLREGGAGGPEEPQEARNGGPKASQEGPPGSQKRCQTLWILTICGSEASQGGSKQQDEQNEQQEGPKGVNNHLWGRGSGALMAPRGPQVGPKGLPGGALRGAKMVETSRLFNDSWFGSKSWWHQATRPTRRAPRGPQGAYATL